jgi:hypothetical protein
VFEFDECGDAEGDAAVPFVDAGRWLRSAGGEKLPCALKSEPLGAIEISTCGAKKWGGIICNGEVDSLDRSPHSVSKRKFDPLLLGPAGGVAGLSKSIP